jgi:predicted phosphodiesterase
MEKFTFYADTHIGSPYLELNILPKTKDEVIAQNAYDLGDSFEMKNCEKDILADLGFRQSRHFLNFADRYVTGNHQCDKGVGRRHIIIVLKDGRRVIMAHYDYILWGIEKALKFRNERMGQGSGFIQRALAKRNGSISNSDQKLLIDYAKEFMGDIIIGGHVHPKQIFDETKDRVRVICCPRGKTELWL